MNDLASITQRKAQKLHFCDDCGRPILRGCEYLSIHGQQNGKYFYKKEHIHCDAVVNAYCAETGREVFYGRLDSVVEWLRDSVCPGCIESGTCRRAGQDTFSCQIALRRVLPPTVLYAALQSVKENEEECP